MRRLLAPILICTALAGTALAGAKFTQPGAFINPATSSAGTYLGHTRNSANTTEWGACTVSTDQWGNLGFRCYAVDPTGAQASCYGPYNDPNMGKYLAALATINNDSYVFFSWNKAGQCTYLAVETNSGFAPKQP